MKYDQSVATGGKLEMFGEFNSSPFTHLQKSIVANQTVLLVRANTNWKVNQQILISETDFPSMPGTYYDDAFDQNELRVISNIQRNVACAGIIPGNCDKITVDSPVKYLHYAGKEYQGYVAHLSRNIVIEGDDASNSNYLGGHLMIRPTTRAILKGVEFRVKIFFKELA